MRERTFFVLIMAAALFSGFFFSSCRATAPSARPDKGPSIEEHFPGYKPKTTPDTVFDFRPQLGDRVAKLPPAALESLPGLLDELVRHKALALKNPGEWQEGMIPLGGDPQEYNPSDEELLVGELGDRIGQVVAAEKAEAVQRVLSAAGFKETAIEYGRILFRHVDVLGSGRFFYATSPVNVVIQIKIP